MKAFLNFLFFLQLSFLAKGNFSIKNFDSVKCVFSNENATNIEDLALLCKIWGVLKYSHPSFNDGSIDADRELLSILPSVINSQDINTRNNLLNDWITKFSGVKASRFKKKDVLKKNNWIFNSKLNDELIETLTNLISIKRKSKNYYFEINQEVGNCIFTNEKDYIDSLFPSQNLRLLSLFRYWNAVNYFYPYKELMDEPWGSILPEFIPKMIEATDINSYHSVLRLLVTKLNDTHSIIYYENIKSDIGNFISPFQLSYIEKKTLVTGKFTSKSDTIKTLNFGDEILSIQGEDIESFRERVGFYSSGSNEQSKQRVISSKLFRSNDSILRITFNRNGHNFDTIIKLVKYEAINPIELVQSNRSGIEVIDNNIAYMYLGNLKNDSLHSFMSTKQDSLKGIIIDLRCYPKEFICYSLTKYLSKNNKKFARFTSVDLKNIGSFSWNGFARTEKSKNSFNGKIVVLVNELTQSQAEFTAMALKSISNVIIIGSNTAGADGDICSLNLPGGIITKFSGIGVYYPNGDQTQRTGITPDIFVDPTIKSITQGKDILLEKAINLINN